MRESGHGIRVRYVLIGELLDIALANVDPRRIEITVFEEVNLNKEVVGGLTQLVTELADNAIAFSDPGDGITVTGTRDGESYVISISDNGVGVPDSLVSALNEVLSNPEGGGAPVGSMGIATVARLAARHDLDVRLIPSTPGTTARVRVPERFMDSGGREGAGDETPEPPRVATSLPASSHLVGMTEAKRLDTEAFLELVFGPFRGQVFSRRPLQHTESSNGGNRHAPNTPTGPQLQTRVPGENFDVADDDNSTASGEAAVDIRRNLGRFDEGRRAAEDDHI